MKRKTVAILTTLLALGGLFLAFQNFTFEKDETSKVDLSSAIDESEVERADHQAEVEKQAQPNRLGSEGLTTTGQMKRVRLEGDQESVTAKDSSSNPIFESPERDPASAFDQDLKRVEEELGEDN
jgi:hypothetical protein